MNLHPIDVYHHMPAALRSVAATFWGLHLRSWRYGNETERLVQEALEREQWSEATWDTWRTARLERVLHRAATLVPYYREQWRKRRLKGDNASFEELANWPLLPKEEVRSHPGAFVADDCSTRRMYHEHTSGSTGKPLDLWWTRETVRAWYALFEARFRRWCGLSRHDRWAILGGQMVIRPDQKKPPYWVWNAGLRQLYFSPFHLSPATASDYFDALRRYRVRYLWGQSSSIFTLAENALHLKLPPVSLDAVITNAEPLYGYQRRVIRDAFPCQLRETYGMAEIVAAASQCESGEMHLWPEVGIVETVEGDRPVAPGTAGELICTGLLNADMPLIRYRVGDRGALGERGISCKCGRTLPILKAIEGRIDDLIYTRDGRHMGPVDVIFRDRLPIREGQIIQESFDFIRIKVVPAEGFQESDVAELTTRMKELAGQGITVEVERVDHIPRTQGAKFKAVLSRVGRQ